MLVESDGFPASILRHTIMYKREKFKTSIASSALVPADPLTLETILTSHVRWSLHWDLWVCACGQLLHLHWGGCTDEARMNGIHVGSLYRGKVICLGVYVSNSSWMEWETVSLSVYLVCLYFYKSAMHCTPFDGFHSGYIQWRMHVGRQGGAETIEILICVKI